jgi:hypothetical protein
MTRRTRRLQCRRNKSSGTHQQQQTSRNQALHIFPKRHALPSILAHHRRTPQKNRQSFKTALLPVP